MNRTTWIIAGIGLASLAGCTLLVGVGSYSSGGADAAPLGDDGGKTSDQSVPEGGDAEFDAQPDASTSPDGSDARPPNDSGGSEGGCTTSSECPPSAPCCGTDGGCMGAPSTPNNGQCRCTNVSECPGGACTPNGGVYTCQPNDALPGHGCAGTGNCCGSGYDCVIDCHGNDYCAQNSGTCPTGFCAVPSPACDNCIESCSNDCMLCTCE